MPRAVAALVHRPGFPGDLVLGFHQGTQLFTCSPKSRSSSMEKVVLLERAHGFSRDTHRAMREGGDTHLFSQSQVSLTSPFPLEMSEKESEDEGCLMA